VLAAAALGCASSGLFTRELPGEVPDTRGWEKKTGRARCANPVGVIDFELFVSPLRPMVYSVTRYRITLASKQTPENEKLQWDKDGRDVRRYECLPAGADAPCRWREFAHGTAEYDHELGALMTVYFGSSPGVLERAGVTPGKP
jgi:hypothetical protein